MSVPNVVRCDAGHLEGMVRLIEQVRADEYALAGTAGVIGSVREAFAAGRPFWVALAGEEVVGCVGLDRLDEHVGILRALFVAFEHRGDEGVGHALLKALLDEARAEGFAEIVLDSHPSFRAAHRFYARSGFTRMEPGEGPSGFRTTFRGNVAFRLALPT